MVVLNKNIILSGLAVGLLLLALSGCRSSARPINAADLASPDSLRRIQAIRWAAAQGDPGIIAQIIPLEGDEDPAVRFYAGTALRHIRNTAPDPNGVALALVKNGNTQ